MLAAILLAAALGSAADALAQSPSDACAGLGPADLRCSVVKVPENHGVPSGRAIPLRVAVLPARGPKPAGDPIFARQLENRGDGVRD